MKHSQSNVTRIAAVAMLCLITLVSSSMAATKHPLNYPYGLAVDAKGNLYVANTNGNEVLVYGANHVQASGKTVTQGVSTPNAVAFDPNGNLWVGNGSNPASITEYSPTGVQNTAATITQGITQPNAIAFDGLANLWVEDNYANLVMYPQFQTQPLFSLPAGAPITGLGFHQGFASVGGNSGTFVFETSYLINSKGVVGQIPPTCFAMAYNAAGYLYCGNEDRALVGIDSAYHVTVLAQLGFFPTGLAVDSTRGLIYVANGPSNQIAVYGTTGTLLATIK